MVGREDHYQTNSASWSSSSRQSQARNSEGLIREKQGRQTSDTTLLGAYILVWHLNYLDSIMHDRSANLTSCSYDLLESPERPELCVRTFLHMQSSSFALILCTLLYTSRSQAASTMTMRHLPRNSWFDRSADAEQLSWRDRQRPDSISGCACRTLCEARLVQNVASLLDLRPLR